MRPKSGVAPASRRCDFRVLGCTLIARSAFLVVLVSSIVHAQWAPVAPGIDYRQLRIEGPMEVFVARADRGRKNWTIDTCMGKGMLKSGRETLSELAARMDDAVNFSGERYDVKVAVNGDYFSFKTDQPPGGQIISGWFAKRFGEYTGGSGFVWRSDRRCFLGGNVRNAKAQQRVFFADSTEMPIQGLNAARGENELVLYTPQYADRTYTSADGVEVLVRVAHPVGVEWGGRHARGEIVEVRKEAGSTLLPFDHVVLSGHGKAARALVAHARVGQKLRIALRLKDYGTEGVSPGDWQNAYASIGGHFYCVANGKVPVERWEPKGKSGAVKRHPRTAVAFDDRYVYFIVVDGRSERSVGMTITELGRFCLEHLAATYAIAQDGGGSSTMWVDGKVMNRPSDGKERPVANGYVMALVAEPKRSSTFSPSKRVRPTRGAELRLGPGTNYAVAGNPAAGQTYVIVEHRLNGIYAKGSYWWKCRQQKLEGWLSEKQVDRSR